MIIFGWGHQTVKNYGVVFKNQCGNCKNDDYWQLIKTTTWFTLFFIPIIPYNVRHLLICPICEHGVELNNTKAYEFKNIAEANTDLINNKITMGEYQERVGEPMKNKKQKIINGNIVEEKKMFQDTKKTGIKKICNNCGENIKKDSFFCPQCGYKIN
ncbi:zinc-ribbon domain-containing protein [Candidatus Parcubacteria bacterium]|nr:zinc-ribbon domain-containing protein [Candidatus Parcubacteria bacterium]